LVSRRWTALATWGVWILQVAIPLVIFALLASKGRFDDPDWRDQSAGFVGLLWILVMFVGLAVTMRDLIRRALPGFIGLAVWLVSFGLLWWLISVA
jgi:hypothetical protein